MVNGEVFEIRLGLPGSGKTLTMTELIVLPALIEGLDVYCNYWINWSLPNYHYFEDFDEIIGVRNCVVVFDEIQTVLDPRAWDKESSEVRRFFQQHRKHHVDIYGTTQHLSLIAKSALIIIDKFIMCEKKYNDGFLANIKLPFVIVQETEMMLSEIKQEDDGFHFNFNNSSDDVFDVDMSMGVSKVHWFRNNKLLHYELDDNKSEFFYYQCSKCGYSVHDIPKTLEFETIVNEASFCPKHKTQTLSVLDSPMYDTNYLVKPVIKSHMWKAFKKCACGRLEPFSGYITEDEFLAKSRLDRLSLDTFSLKGCSSHPDSEASGTD